MYLNDFVSNLVRNNRGWDWLMIRKSEGILYYGAVIEFHNGINLKIKTANFTLESDDRYFISIGV